MKSLPVIYVAGMAVTYSLLGVVAGMTGNVFGAQLANPIFNWSIAFIMLFLGFSMLGFFNFTKVQTLASKIPLAQNYPRFAVGTMGAVSGLVSAPCTGPVLSMILVLIAQNKNPISGFTYMLFFALGFGLPYAALGFFGQRINRMPRFPRLINFTKIFFAALMFSLAIYYVKGTLQKIPFIQEFYTRPQELTISILIMLAITFTILFTKKGIIGNISKLGLTLSCCVLSLWLTLGATNSFSLRNHITADHKELVHWQTSFEESIKLSKETGKPILFDIWAEWCSACLEMKDTTWKDKSFADYLNTNFITLKLDYTDIPENIQDLVQRWGIQGLPAVGFFKAESNFNGKPDILLQGYTSANQLLSNAKNIRDKS